MRSDGEKVHRLCAAANCSGPRACFVAAALLLAVQHADADEGGDPLVKLLEDEIPKLENELKRRAEGDVTGEVGFVPNLEGAYAASCWLAKTPNNRGESRGFFKVRIDDAGKATGVVIHERDMRDEQGRPIPIERYPLEDADVVVGGTVTGGRLQAVGRELLFGVDSYQYEIVGDVQPVGGGQWRGSGTLIGRELNPDDDAMHCQGQWWTE